jgi:hypothetical protein
MSANDRQVAGTHYKSTYIHWDYVLAVGMQYLEGNATKYLARWDKKGAALTDLEKALHYVEKLIECAALCAIQVNFRRPSRRFIHEETVEFCKANNVTGHAFHATVSLSSWQTTPDLQDASMSIRALIATVRQRPDGDFMRPEPPYQTPVTKAAAPVPVEDSNRHADRAPTK